MAAKFCLFLCASLALVNTIASWPCGAPAVAPACSARPAPAIGGCGLGAGYNAVGGYGLGGGYNTIGGCGLGGGYNAVAVDNGGALGVISASALAPSGLSIMSDNLIEGCVDVTGKAPVLSAVAFEGNLPTAGSAGTAYSCGDGNVGISAESLAAAGLGAASELVGYGLGANAALANAAYGNAALANAAYGNAALANAGLANAITGINFGSLYTSGAGCGCGGIYV